MNPEAWLKTWAFDSSIFRHLHKGKNNMSKYVKKGYPTKLSNKDIEDIKKRLVKGETQKSIAKLYNVSQTYISMIKTGNARATR